MKYILFVLVFAALNARASVIGITTHPLNEEARVLSAEMTGYMSQRQEMGMGLRYTQEVNPGQRLDIAVGSAQYSRGLFLGGGMDFELLREEGNQPRISLKPYYQYQKFEGNKQNVMGAAPTIRRGFSIEGYEFFPYLAFPSGLKIDSATDTYDYYASATLGASMPFPGAEGERFLLSFEGNKNLGAASDYLGVLFSWVWK